MPDESTPRLRVLIADDDYAECRRLEDLLTACGADVDTASDGLVVLGLVRKHAYDALFLDNAMPVMDGWQTARILRADSRFRQLPLIAMLDRPDGSDSSGGPARAAEEARLLQLFSGLERKPLSADAAKAALLLHAPPEKRRAAAEAAIPAMTPPPASSKTEKENKGMNRPDAEATEASHTMDATRLHDLDGFDVDQGLARILGNEKLYLRLLGDFERCLHESDAEIRAAEQVGMPELLAAIHKLKGMSGNVAATRLYTHVVELEKAFRAQPDMDAAEKRARLDAFFTLLSRTIADLAAFNAGSAPRPGGAKPAGPAETKAPADPELERLLQETLLRTREYATSALETFREARQRLGARQEARQQSIEAHLESFEFEEAERELLSLTHSLGIVNISQYEQ